MRSIVLDTETTGLSVAEGHRIIEIGCIELQERQLTGRHFHVYLQPERDIDAGALAVHGITEDFLKDKPRFIDVADDFFSFIKGAQLIIHNADFDIGFISKEFSLAKQTRRVEVKDYCTVLDTLKLAKQRHPGQRNNLDALCRRYSVDNSDRDLHGALLDAQILAEVYLAMTGGQVNLSLTTEPANTVATNATSNNALSFLANRTPVIRASKDELNQHYEHLAKMKTTTGVTPLWLNLKKES
ncbi:UNVERIFIED_CONTAM: hypothetical protein GTU68_040924 [Idotea baltica]|nr:hypothetical protein [Idotea baltica]